MMIIFIAAYVVGWIVTVGVVAGGCITENKELRLWHLVASFAWPVAWVAAITVYFIEQGKEQRD